MRQIVESKITWRGSLSDLATDVAYLLTKQEGEQFMREIERFLLLPHLESKWCGEGHREDPDQPFSGAPPKQ
jgi:hypothetical protein